MWDNKIPEIQDRKKIQGKKGIYQYFLLETITRNPALQVHGRIPAYTDTDSFSLPLNIPNRFKLPQRHLWVTILWTNGILAHSKDKPVGPGLMNSLLAPSQSFTGSKKPLHLKQKLRLMNKQWNKAQRSNKLSSKVYKHTKMYNTTKVSFQTIISIYLVSTTASNTRREKPTSMTHILYTRT